MGSNASVLQWHCRNCTSINPTERRSCLVCGDRRKLDDSQKLISENPHRSRVNGASHSKKYGQNSRPNKKEVDEIELSDIAPTSDRAVNLVTADDEIRYVYFIFCNALGILKVFLTRNPFVLNKSV